MDISKIKLIIWDLDDTLWNGNLMENTVSIPESISKLLNSLLDYGIQHSICSKNSYEETKRFLIDNNLWHNFIFPYINYNSKAENVTKLVKSIKIQPCNILFIDDNPFNRNELKFYFPTMNVYGPEIIHVLEKCSFDLPVKDSKHKKLQEYKIVEKSAYAREQFNSNLDFLRHSDINISINHDCTNQIERVFELGMKTNQLNYTKRRLTREEIEKMVSNKEYDTAYIDVWDKYGDYGIVGFYSLFKNELVDFYFSCRILGMKVEQYIYSLLGYPRIIIEGNVSAPLVEDSRPDWIKINNKVFDSTNDLKNNKNNLSILLRGECDIKQIINYLDENNCIKGEYDKPSLKQNRYNLYNMHTELIVQKYTYSKKRKKSIIQNTFYYDENIYDLKLFEGEYDVILLSLTSDIRQALYKDRKNDNIIVAGEYLYPIVSDNDIEEKSKKSRMCFDKESMADFLARYEYIGAITEDKLLDNLIFIRDKLPEKTKLVLMKNVELVTGELGIQRCNRNKKVNKAIIALNSMFPNNTYIIDLNRFVKNESDILNDILHFKRIIYYSIANELAGIVNEVSNVKLSMPEYRLPYIAVSRQIEIYKKFDTKNFIIFGLDKDTLILAKNLRKKCKYIIDLNADKTYKVSNLLFETMDIVLKEDLDKVYFLISGSYKGENSIKEIISDLNLIEYENYEYFNLCQKETV